MTAKLKSRSAHWQEGSNYAKSADTRQAILHAALKAFGQAGFQTVTTRQIATMAEVNQPAIAYYFKNKERLYLACAEEIIARYADRVAEPALAAYAALERNVAPDEARALLKTVLAALADLLMANDDLPGTAGFVEREMRERGPAYAYFNETFWAPGADLVARLLTEAKGERDVSEATRAEAIMLITSLLAFAPTQSLSIETMGWDAIGEREAALVLETLNRHIDAIT